MRLKWRKSYDNHKFQFPKLIIFVGRPEIDITSSLLDSKW